MLGNYGKLIDNGTQRHNRSGGHGLEFIEEVIFVHFNFNVKL